jgi:serine/threonine protein kinase
VVERQGKFCLILKVLQAITTAMTVPNCIPVDNTVVLASGLWGTVSRVIDEEVVIKVSKDPINGLFEIEKAVFERLGSHENIAAYQGDGVLATGQKQQRVLLIQYYPLGTLREFFNDPGSLEIRGSRGQQLQWAKQVLGAVSYVHSQNIVHGDVGIHNLLVGNDYSLKLTDFGGSSIDGAEMLVECSPRYHRPHSWRFPIAGVDTLAETWKIPSPVMDTYALGTVLFEIFTAKQLYKDETYDQIRSHATNREYPALESIDLPEVRHVIGKCWTEGYTSVKQMIADLSPIWDVQENGASDAE